MTDFQGLAMTTYVLPGPHGPLGASAAQPAAEVNDPGAGSANCRMDRIHRQV